MVNKFGGVEADLTVSAITSGEGTACDPTFEGDFFLSSLNVSFFNINVFNIVSSELYP